MRAIRPRVAAVGALLCSLVVTAQPSDLFSRLNQLQPRRDEPEVARELEDLFTTALKERPDDVPLLLLASRHHAWIADGAADADTRRTRGKRAWELADRALALEPDNVAAHWCAARAIGAYGSGISLFTAIGEGIGGKLDAHMNVVLAKGAELDLGAPLLARGRYFLRVPWPMRNVRKGQDFFERVIQQFPENLRARYYLAELLMKEGHRDEARAQLAQVAQGASEYDPPEARRIKSWATSLSAALERR